MCWPPARCDEASSSSYRVDVPWRIWVWILLLTGGFSSRCRSHHLDQILRVVLHAVFENAPIRSKAPGLPRSLIPPPNQLLSVSVSLARIVLTSFENNTSSNGCRGSCLRYDCVKCYRFANSKNFALRRVRGCINRVQLNITSCWSMTSQLASTSGK